MERITINFTIEKQNSTSESLFSTMKETDCHFFPTEAPCLEEVQLISMSYPPKVQALKTHCILCQECTERWKREVPKPYVPTEEERRLLKECAEESFRYRAFPLAAVSMLGTSFLIRKGVLRDTSRFGSFIKVAFAGMCGYLAGKISYLPICSEKFKKLKDSPIGDVLRQAQRHSSPNRSSRKSEFSDIPSQSFTESSSSRAGFPLSSSYSDDYSSTDRGLSSYDPIPFSASLNESSPTGITDYTVQEPAPVPEESRKKKGITYEELRNKHRGAYDVMVPPKAETPSKLPQEKPAKEVKVNKYGDTWDE